MNLLTTTTTLMTMTTMMMMRNDVVDHDEESFRPTPGKKKSKAMIKALARLAQVRGTRQEAKANERVQTLYRMERDKEAIKEAKKRERQAVKAMKQRNRPAPRNRGNRPADLTRAWFMETDPVTGRRRRRPRVMKPLEFFELICSHKRSGKFPAQALIYAPDSILRKICEVCDQALRGDNVHFTKRQRELLARHKKLIRDLAEKRLPEARHIIQRGGVPPLLVSHVTVHNKSGWCDWCYSCWCCNHRCADATTMTERRRAQAYVETDRLRVSV